MKDLTVVRNFYYAVQEENSFSYEDVGELFADHNVFADPPVFRRVTLPVLGSVELTLVAIEQPGFGASLVRCSVAPDDGTYRYASSMRFLARPTPTLTALGMDPEVDGPFEGLVDLSVVGNGKHENLFGHPLRYFGDGQWPLRSPAAFCVEILPTLVRCHMSRIIPKELHEYPFDDDDDVVVFAKDVTKVGGMFRYVKAVDALRVYRELADTIYVSARGNANIRGCIRSGSVEWVIPAFGSPCVSIDNN